MSNYGQYYDSRNQGTNMQNSLHANQPSNTNNNRMNQASYSGDARKTTQSHYGSSAYDWSTRDAQPSPTYPTSSRQSQYQTETRRESSGTHNGSHGPRMFLSQYATQAAAGMGATGQYNPTTPNTQRLNHLAYASGLDSADAQGTVQHGRRQSLTDSAQYLNQPVIHASQRVQSPVNQHRNQFGTGQSMNYPYHSEAASVASTQAPVTAAMALAGAVSRRYHPSSGSTGQSLASPSIDSSRSMVPTPQRTKSPYNHIPAPVTNSRQSINLPQTKYPSSNYNSMESATHQPESRNQIQNERRKTNIPTANQSSLPVNSISNLVTRTDADEDSSATSYATATDAQGEMSAFIDPTQVFNPFHKEHEQRKREIARAEALAAAQAAAKKAEDEARASAHKKAEEEAHATAKRKAEAEAESARKAKAEQIALAQSRAEETTRAPKKAAKVRPSNAQVQVASPVVPQASLSSEEEMASEMKVMMEKMKEFRSKDPSMFQKLWDDMRGVRSPAIPAATPMQPSPPQGNQLSPLPPQPRPMPQSVISQTSTEAFQSPSNTSTPRNRAPKSAGGVHANGFKVVVENNPEGLPDLGRFPAERRIRGSYTKKNGQDTPPKQVGATNRVVLAGSGSAPVDAPLPTVNMDASDPSLVPAQALALVPTTTATETAQPVQPVVLSRGLPPKAPGGGTIWPEDKRNALAVAAVSCLKDFANKGYPGNADIEITPQDIHAILEGNPSYVDLCEILEKKGFRFHRGQFASQLLANVPFLNGAPAPAKQQSQTPVAQPPKQMAPVAEYPPVPASNTTAPHPTAKDQSASAPRQITDLTQPGLEFIPTPPPHQANALKEGQLMIKPERPPLYIQPYVPKSKPPKGQKSLLTRPEPPMGSKEAMARKRDFSELIDLTVLSDNEDYVLSKKHARMENSPPGPDAFQDYQTQMIPGPPMPPHKAFPSGPRDAAEPFRFHPGPQPGPYPGPHPGPLPPGQNGFVSVHQIHSTVVPARPLVLAKPIDRAEGLTKTYYDPKTVARDILIASGRHPTERPLNGHMAGLLGKHIDIDSDLATFDWDAIDPGGPPMPQVAYVEFGAIPPQNKPGQQTGREAQLGAQSVVRGGHGRGTAGHSTSSSSDKHAISAKTQPPNHTSVTYRTAPPMIAPQHAPSSASAMSNPLRDASVSLVKRLAALRQSQTSEPASDSQKKPGHPSRKPSASRPKSSPHISSDQPGPVTGVIMASNDAPTVPRGRGRPPKSATFDAPKLGTADAPKFSSTGKRIGRPPGAKNKTMSIRAMQQNARQVTSVTIPSPSPSTPHLPLFKCRWKCCRAQLHNASTLLQHIRKLHGQVEDNIGEYACWWRKCQYLKADSDGMWQPVKTFLHLEDWVEHVALNHIHIIVLKQGDGPSTKHIGKRKKPSFDVSHFRFVPPFATKTRTFCYLDPQTILMDKARYLADENGHNTTPMISTQTNEDLASDTMALLPASHDTEDEAAQRSFLKTHRDDKRAGPKATAEETLRSLTELKTNFGPGMANEGCVLARESVKTRLQQNPAIARVVEIDD
ncbi:hypothetical protein LTR84_010069 [Exophiala bonariae]|uniref:C2H2-type domain-containing protein n=1 Tax=Exophiala bonariae TaxID=1690606 RepID=A0AAV9NK88_9EURO|nr:hypothetical protein LTR84_010069 [Exophiala bonariae]